LEDASLDALFLPALKSACSLVPAANTPSSVIYCLSKKEIFKGVLSLVLFFPFKEINMTLAYILGH
jgi:hypothetical protein